MILIFITSCTKNTLLELSDIESSTTPINLNIANNKDHQLSRTTLNKLAQSLSLSLNNSDFQDFVKEEVDNLWGGDLQFLIQNKFNTKIKNGNSFGEHLKQNNLDPVEVTELLNSKKLRLLATENTYEKIKNRGIENALVVIEANNLGSDKFLEAYNTKGKKVFIPASEEPSNPVFVVGNCEICTEEMAKQITEVSKNGPSFIRRINGFGEFLTKIRIPNVSIIEVWTQGRPEMRLIAIAYKIQTGTASIVKETPLPSYSIGAWQSGLNFDTDPAYTPGFFMFNWYFNNTNGYTAAHGFSYYLQLWE